jgi:hypothetical protein
VGLAVDVTLLLNKRVSVAMQWFPCTILFPKDLRSSQRSPTWVLLAAHPRSFFATQSIR